MNKIEKIIYEEFDNRLESAVIGYIFDEGINNIINMTEEYIESVEGNALMTKNFVQSLMRCAKRICMECNYSEIINFIRFDMLFAPNLKNVYLYREDFTHEGFKELLYNLELDDEEVGNELILKAVVDKNCLKETEYDEFD